MVTPWPDENTSGRSAAAEISAWVEQGPETPVLVAPGDRTFASGSGQKIEGVLHHHDLR